MGDSKKNEKFMEEQFKIFKEATNQILDNVVEHHAEECDTPEDKECEKAFVAAFMILFDRRLAYERGKLIDLIAGPNNLN